MNVSRNTTAKDGVALIVVLGLLAVLGLLIIAFSHSMRDQRLVSRGATQVGVAGNLLHAALARAIEDTDASVAGYTYPCWVDRDPTYRADAMSSIQTGLSDRCSILANEATNYVPRALWDDALVAASNCSWVSIQYPGESGTHARIAYLVLNASGLLDANEVGGAPRTSGTSVAEIDLADLPDILPGMDVAFYTNRTRQVRYESLPELAAVNPAMSGPPSNLFVCSYDTNRDVIFTTTNGLGTPFASLTNKLCVNTIDPGETNGWDRLIYLLSLAGLPAPEAVAWNLVNYVDADRVPDDGSALPYMSDTVCEAVPLINEIVLAEDPPSSTSYVFKTELWFPFYPARVQTNDGMWLQTEVYWPTGTLLTSTEDFIDAMEFGNTNTELRTFSVTNIVLIVASNPVPVTATNPIGFRARVVIKGPAGTSVVDQALGLEPFPFPGVANWSVRDPRKNALPSDWDVMLSDSLGRTNDNATPWAPGCQGLPLVHPDAPMQNVGEIGYLFTGVPWKSIDLLTYSGGQLLDSLTVRSNVAPARGLVGLSSRQIDVLRALFTGETIGQVSTPNADVDKTVRTTNETLSITNVDALAGTLHGPYLSLADAFDEIGSNGWYQAWAPDLTHTTGDLKEDAWRGIVEMLTFRQNLFTVFVAAQQLATDGVTPVSEARGVALVVRDSYTGSHYVRSFLPLSR